MIKIYPKDELGHHDHGWLNTRYHFSFASYYNPNRKGFGALKVINDDIITPKSGFDFHSHKNMEIITYVRSGEISHEDSQGNSETIRSGSVQVMSAGSGIVHSEYNLGEKDASLYQIWIAPNKQDVSPKWATKSFSRIPIKNELTLLVSGDNSALLHIHQDAFIYSGKFEAGTKIRHTIKNQAYILICLGKIKIDGKLLNRSDGAEVTGQSSIEIEAVSDAEILIIDVPSQ